LTISSFYQVVVIDLYLLNKFLSQSADFIKITFSVQGVIFRW